MCGCGDNDCSCSSPIVHCVSHCVLQSVNKAMQKDRVELTIGVLDIYGFEIFMVRNRGSYVLCIHVCTLLVVERTYILALFHL